MGIYGNVYLYIHIYICTPFFCVWLQKLIYCFIENNSYRPNNSVTTSKTCVVNFFLGMEQHSLMPLAPMKYMKQLFTRQDMDKSMVIQ